MPGSSRSLFRRLSTFVALLVGLALTPPALARTNFVYTSGREFHLNGARFRHVGVNVAPILYMTWDQQADAVRQLAAAGVKQIRLFAPNNAYGGSAATNLQLIGDRLQRLVDYGYYNHGIRFTVALAHGYDAPSGGWERGCRGYDAGGNCLPGQHIVKGDEGFYSVDWGGMKVINADWIWWGYASNYRPFARGLAARFKDHPGIFAWDIANEVKNPLPDTTNLQKLVEFYKFMAADLKSVDPDHLVTTGLAGTSWALLPSNMADDLYRHPSINYITIHPYNNNPNDGVYADFSVGQRVNKPVVVEEIGISRHAFPSDFWRRVRGAYTEMYNKYNAAAVLQWGVQFGNYGAGDEHFGPYEQGMVDWYKWLWSHWAGEMAAWNNNPNVIVIDNYNVNNDTSRGWFVGNANWAASTFDPFYFGTGYNTALTINGAEDGVTFYFCLPSAQARTVDAWWTQGTTRTTFAPHVMYNSNGTHVGTAYANQTINGGRWNQLGTFNFSAGCNNRVVVSRWTGEGNTYVIADAIRIR